MSMDTSERNLPVLERDYPKGHIQPIPGRGIFREAPRDCYTGFRPAPGTQVILDSAKNPADTDNVPSTLYRQDRDHTRICFVPKPAIAGGAVKLSSIVSSTQYQFKSSYDKPEEKK